MQQKNHIKHFRVNLFNFAIKQQITRLVKLKKGKFLQSKNQHNPKYYLKGQQIPNVAALSNSDFSNNKKYFAVSGSKQATIYSLPNCLKISNLQGHTQKVHDVKFHPKIGQISEKSPNIATVSSDKQLRLWTLIQNQTNQKSFVLKKHQNRVNRCLFLPQGTHIITTSHDATYKIWDLTRGQELYTQNGHTYPVYTQSLHPDSSLLFTGDLGGLGAMWDLRIGKNLYLLKGHSDGIMCSDFSKQGRIIVTGSMDNTIRFWDIRRQNCVMVLPGHSKLISDIKYVKNSSNLMSVSYDQTLKVWDGEQFQMLKNIHCHQSKLTSLSLLQELLLVTTMDGKWSLWTQQGIEIEDALKKKQKLQQEIQTKRQEQIEKEIN